MTSFDAVAAVYVAFNGGNWPAIPRLFSPGARIIIAGHNWEGRGHSGAETLVTYWRRLYGSQIFQLEIRPVSEQLVVARYSVRANLNVDIPTPDGRSVKITEHDLIPVTDAFEIGPDGRFTSIFNSFFVVGLGPRRPPGM